MNPAPSQSSDVKGANIVAPAGNILRTGLFGPPLTPTLLRIDPDWDNLRDDPRFEKLSQGK